MPTDVQALKVRRIKPWSPGTVTEFIGEEEEPTLLNEYGGKTHLRVPFPDGQDYDGVAIVDPGGHSKIGPLYYAVKHHYGPTAQSLRRRE